MAVEHLPKRATAIETSRRISLSKRGLREDGGGSGGSGGCLRECSYSGIDYVLRGFAKKPALGPNFVEQAGIPPRDRGGVALDQCC